MSNVKWYYARGKERFGPVAWDNLRQIALSATLRPADLVWCKGMTDWQRAETVAGLFAPSRSPPSAGVTARSEHGESPGAEDALSFLNQPPSTLSDSPSPHGPRRDLAGTGMIAWGYRAALAVAIIGVFLPWIQSSVSASHSGVSTSFGGHPISVPGASMGATTWVNGLLSPWGWLTPHSDRRNRCQLCLPIARAYGWHWNRRLVLCRRSAAELLRFDWFPVLGERCGCPGIGHSSVALGSECILP